MNKENVRNAFLLVDLQNDFIEGTLAAQADANQSDGLTAVKNAAKFVLENAKAGDLVYASQDTHGEDYMETQEGRKLPIVHTQKGTWGWKIHSALNEVFKTHDVHVFEKELFAANNIVKDLECKHLIDPVGHIYIQGICTDICVISTALAIKGSKILQEVEVSVNEIGCAGLNGEAHKAALLVMASNQITII